MIKLMMSLLKRSPFQEPLWRPIPLLLLLMMTIEVQMMMDLFFLPHTLISNDDDTSTQTDTHSPMIFW